MEGALAMCTHLSLVASRLSPRPNRPDREVVFRPYSSRDAREFVITVEECVDRALGIVLKTTPLFFLSFYRRTPQQTFCYS
jgi:hypothetical protein